MTAKCDAEVTALADAIVLAGACAMIVAPPLARPPLARLRTRGDATRGDPKRAARRLFAERGIAGVAMRDIEETAGQRDAAAVHDYFGGKDNRLREPIVDGARTIDAGGTRCWRRRTPTAGPIAARRLSRVKAACPPGSAAA